LLLTPWDTRKQMRRTDIQKCECDVGISRLCGDNSKVFPLCIGRTGSHREQQNRCWESRNESWVERGLSAKLRNLFILWVRKNDYVLTSTECGCVAYGRPSILEEEKICNLAQRSVALLGLLLCSSSSLELRLHPFSLAMIASW
jgi:hypothetical protein